MNHTFTTLCTCQHTRSSKGFKSMFLERAPTTWLFTRLLWVINL